MVVYFTESDKKSGSFFRNLYKDYKAYFYQYIYGPNDYMQLFNLAKNCMYQSINLIHAQSATTATATVTAVSEAKVSEVTIKGLYNKDSKALTETTDLSKDLFYVELELKDQYGNVITDASKLDQILITQSNPNVVNAAASASVVDVDGTKKVLIPLTGTPNVGQNVITVIALASGKSASYTVNVGESTRAYNVDVAARALAVEDEEILIPVNVTDKDGNPITDLDVLKDNKRGIQVTVDGVDKTSNLVVKDGQVYLAQTFTSTGYKSVVVISKATQKVDTLTLDVKEAAKPTSIIGVASTFLKTIKTTSQDVEIDWDDLRILDQYGRELTTAQKKAAATTGVNGVVYSVVLSEPASSAHDNIAIDTADLTNTPATVDGVAKGTDTLVFTLKAGTTLIAETAFETSIRITDGTEYQSYQVEDVPTVFVEAAANAADDNKYDCELKVYGVLADGSKVQLDPSEYTVRSSNAKLNADLASDTKIDAADGMNLDWKDAEGKDVTTETVKLTVTINETGQEFTKDVVFSKAAPEVKSVKVVKGDTTATLTSPAVSELKFAANDTDFDTTTLTTAPYGIVVTDLYGVDTLAEADGSVIFVADNDGTGPNVALTAAAPYLTITRITGDFTISGNGTAGASVASIDAGDVFNAKLTYAGGSTVTIKVTK